MASSVINSIIRLASVVPLSTTRGYILYSYSFSYLEIVSISGLEVTHQHIHTITEFISFR